MRLTQVTYGWPNCLWMTQVH